MITVDLNDYLLQLFLNEIVDRLISYVNMCVYAIKHYVTS